MIGPQSLQRVTLALGLIVAGAIIGPLRAHAQSVPCEGDDPGCGDPFPPMVEISPSSGSYIDPDAQVTITWCDNVQLVASSRSISLNGNDVTSNFDYVYYGEESGCWGGRAESTGTVTLAPGNNFLSASISDGYNTGFDASTYGYDDTPPPVVSIAPHNGDYVSAGMCAACFDLTYAHSTPPYLIFDAAQSVTLFYSSAQAAPMGQVSVDVWHQAVNPNPPDTVSLSLKRPDGTWVTFTSGTNEIFYEYGVHGVVQLAAQFDASSLPTGAYGYTAVVRSWWYSGGVHSEEATRTLRVLIQNESDGLIMPGWTVAGIQTIIPQGDTLLVLLDGAGTIIAFDRVAADVFRAPRGDFTEIRRDPSTNQYVRLWPDSTEATFELQGDGTYKIISLEDRFGQGTSFGYWSSGRPASILNPLAKLTWLYESATWNGLSKIVDPQGRETIITGDVATRNLLSIQDPDGLSQSFTYDAEHRIRSSTDRAGATTDYTYDVWRKLSTITLPEVTLHDSSVGRPEFSYLPSVHKAILPDGAGGIADRVARVEPEDHVGIAVGPRNDTTRMWFNFLGQPVTVEDAVGRTASTSYNAHGLPISTTLPSGQVISRSWTQNRLTAETVSGLISTQFSYEPTFGLLSQAKVNNKVVYTNFYDALGVLDSVQIAELDTAIVHHADALGRDTAVVDREGHVTRYEYDPGTQNLGQVVRPGGQTSVTVFDAYGRDSLLINPTSDTTRIVYDALNRVVAVYDPVNPNPTRTHFGPIYADSLTDPKGERYRFVHNVLGWVTERYGPASATHADRYGFDVGGNVVRWTNRNGQTIDYTLDLLGRATNVTAPDDTLQFGYDPAGQDRFMWGKNAWGVDTTWFTPAGFVDSTKTARGAAAYAVGYDWHWSGQPTAIRDWHNGRTITMYYNDSGQLDTLLVHGRKTYVDLRNSDQQTLSRVYPAEWNQTLQHTSDHRRASIAWGNLVTRGIGFDSAGRVTLLDPEGELFHEFEYDGLGRLVRRDIYEMGTGECHWNGGFGFYCEPSGAQFVSSDTYSYDAIGNRTDGGAVIDPGSRLRRIKAHSDTLVYSYDAAGSVIRSEERISGEVQDLYWSALGQLDSVVITSGSGTQRVDFRYDAFGRRIQKSNASSSIDYVWTGDHILFDIKDGTVTEYSYLPGTDRLHSQYRAEQFQYYLTDHLGSVAAIADSAGTKSNSYTYDPWGLTESTSEQLENRFRFAGRDFDVETGLYYVRARYYDAACGRFISEDPIGLAGGINPYAYAGNSPVTSRDPSGLSRCFDWVIKDWSCGGIGNPGEEQNPHCEPNWKSVEVDCRRPGGPQRDHPNGYGGGGGASDSPELRRPPPPAERNQFLSCGRAILGAGFSFGSDVLIFTGVGLALKGVKGARAAVKVSAGVGRFVSEATAFNLRSPRTARQVVNASGNLLFEGFMSLVGTADAGGTPTLRGVLLDIAPVIGTIRAFGDVGRACF